MRCGWLDWRDAFTANKHTTKLGRLDHGSALRPDCGPLERVEIDLPRAGWNCATAIIAANGCIPARVASVDRIVVVRRHPAYHRLNSAVGAQFAADIGRAYDLQAGRRSSNCCAGVWDLNSMSIKLSGRVTFCGSWQNSAVLWRGPTWEALPDQPET